MTGFGWHCLSNAGSFVLCVFRRFADHRTLLRCSPLLKNACVRQVAWDKWLPLMVQRNLVARLWTSTGPLARTFRRASASEFRQRGRRWQRSLESIIGVFVDVECRPLSGALPLSLIYTARVHRERNVFIGQAYLQNHKSWARNGLARR